MVGPLKTSAQVKEKYTIKKLTGKNILVVINMPQNQIGKFVLDFLILSPPDTKGDVLLVLPNWTVTIGEKL